MRGGSLRQRPLRTHDAEDSYFQSPNNHEARICSLIREQDVERCLLRGWEVMLGPVYAAAIALVALIGNFRALHKAVRFASRGRQCSVSQK